MTIRMAHCARVRLWTPGDSETLVEISNWAGLHTNSHFRCPRETACEWEHRLQVRSEVHPCLVAESNGRPVGYAAAQSFGGGCGFRGVAEVSVYIHHECTGAGLGTQLYECLIATLAAQGYCRLVALIVAPNPASERLHRRFEFRHVGLLERIGWKVDQWHDVAYWQRDLTCRDSAPVSIRPVCKVFGTEGLKK